MLLVYEVSSLDGFFVQAIAVNSIILSTIIYNYFNYCKKLKTHFTYCIIEKQKKCVCYTYNISNIWQCFIGF